MDNPITLAPKRKNTVNSEHIDTIIGEGAVFDGNISVKGGIRIDGGFNGDIVAKGKLAVGRTGVLKSKKVEVNAAVIGGTVYAELEAPELVKLESSSKFRGNISTKVLIIEQGAVFDGRANMNALLDQPEELETKE